MHRPQEQVRQFHREILEGPTSPAEPKVRNPELRAALILEEALETALALVGSERVGEILLDQVEKIREQGPKEPDLALAIDGCIDTLYVTYGTLEDIGVDGEPFFDEVHRSNMAKRDPERKQAASKSPVGKVLKPSGWKPPDIRRLLEQAKLDWLISEVRGAIERGDLPRAPTREERIDWVYGNCRLSNENVTREMVEKAADRIDEEKK